MSKSRTPKTAARERAPRGAPQRPKRAPSPPKSGLRPIEAPRAEPAEPVIPRVDDLEDYALPPLHAKAHPPGDMSEAKCTIDDPVRGYHHHPNDAAAMEFDVDPEAADAAADLAGDLGAQFLEGATFGEDMSERALEDGEASETELPFVLDDELGFEGQRSAVSGQRSALDDTRGQHPLRFAQRVKKADR